jgi:hypothetical protein
MISERTLRRWRRQSLLKINALHCLPKEGLNVTAIEMKELNERILRLTQELGDIKLVRKET